MPIVVGSSRTAAAATRLQWRRKVLRFGAAPSLERNVELVLEGLKRMLVMAAAKEGKNDGRG